jgi:hypothetical protein
MPTHISVHGNPPMVAGGNILPSRFIKITGNQTVTQCSANTDAPFGIAADGVDQPPNFAADLSGQSVTENAARTGFPVEYFSLGQYMLLRCGVQWTAGQLLMSHTDGSGAPRTSTNPVGARALTNASVGEFRIVQVLDGRP